MPRLCSHHLHTYGTHVNIQNVITKQMNECQLLDKCFLCKIGWAWMLNCWWIELRWLSGAWVIWYNQMNTNCSDQSIDYCINSTVRANRRANTATATPTQQHCANVRHASGNKCCMLLSICCRCAQGRTRKRHRNYAAKIYNIAVERLLTFYVTPLLLYVCTYTYILFRSVGLDCRLVRVVFTAMSDLTYKITQKSCS